MPFSAWIPNLKGFSVGEPPEGEQGRPDQLFKGLSVTYFRGLCGHPALVTLRHEELIRRPTG
jgi:hypothetical protein